MRFEKEGLSGDLKRVKRGFVFAEIKLPKGIWYKGVTKGFCTEFPCPDKNFYNGNLIHKN
jgi:hypothetical protein